MHRTRALRRTNCCPRRRRDHLRHVVVLQSGGSRHGRLSPPRGQAGLHHLGGDGPDNPTLSPFHWGGTRHGDRSLTLPGPTLQPSSSLGYASPTLCCPHQCARARPNGAASEPAETAPTTCLGPGHRKHGSMAGRREMLHDIAGATGGGRRQAASLVRRPPAQGPRLVRRWPGGDSPTGCEGKLHAKRHNAREAVPTTARQGGSTVELLWCLTRDLFRQCGCLRFGLRRPGAPVLPLVDSHMVDIIHPPSPIPPVPEGMERPFTRPSAAKAAEAVAPGVTRKDVKGLRSAECLCASVGRQKSIPTSVKGRDQDARWSRQHGKQ